MQSVNDKSGYYAVILFLIWPLLAVISALRNYSSGWGKNILWAFVAFYGFAFAIGTESQNSDIVRYVTELEYLAGIKMTFSGAIQYYMESGEIDVLRTFLAVLVSRFTSESAVLTLIYGIIFGYFFSRNMWFVLERLKGKIQPIVLILVACLFLIIPIWQINGFRFWTAAHIFIYGLLLFLFDQKKGGIVVSLLSLLVHFAFIVPIGILLGYLIAGNRPIIYFCFFFATIFVSEIDVTALNNIIESYAPEIIQDRSSGYRGEEKVEAYREETNTDTVWYAVWYGRLLKWSIMGFLVILFIKGRDFFRNNLSWGNLFSFTLLFYGVANLFSSLPSGGRYSSIANVIALVLIILYIQNKEQETVMERFVWFATPALLLFILVAFRIGLYSMSATAVLGNPVIAILFMGEHISLNDVMKMIL
ncbi:hypothetical protein [Fodinibius sp. Rm-B-1B1-1]|uniref:hypothetical protein n=1 Tax=Fodinibius alkaliphilus TaxID=3140241 RepID=UPI003159ABDE